MFVTVNGDKRPYVGRAVPALGPGLGPGLGLTLLITASSGLCLKAGLFLIRLLIRLATEGGQLKLIAILHFFFGAKKLTRESDWREKRFARPLAPAKATQGFARPLSRAIGHRYQLSEPRIRAASPFIFAAI